MSIAQLELQIAGDNDLWRPNTRQDSLLEGLAAMTAGLRDTDGAVINPGGIGHNYGATFTNEVFALRDYCWCEGDEPGHQQ